MNTLICGHRSFAAQGLADALVAAGHRVTTFSRGALAQHGDEVTGPVLELDTNPHLTGSFDTVINYILLKDQPVAPNIAFIDALLRFCQARQVRHLVHISSISSYASTSLITEDAALEQVPERKGSYGSLKSATDLHLLAKVPPELKLTMVRPGFILAPGVVSPIVGNAFRLPWNKLMVIGSKRRIMPLIARGQVNQAVVKVVTDPPAEQREVVLLVAPNSPTIGSLMEACCADLGCGLAPVSYPAWVWRVIAVGAQVAAWMLGQGKLQPYQKIASRLEKLRFENSRTMQRLGVSLDLDWRAALRDSLEGESSNYTAPYRSISDGPGSVRGVTFLGFGRIVKQKHLPALKKLGFSGEIRACDLCESVDASGQKIEALDSAEFGGTDLVIIASPGPAHTEAIPRLGGASGTVLVEKPLCYNEQQLDEWRRFAQSRSAPVIVCHNYRFKPNVEQMMAVLARNNSGQINHATVHFQSPPVSNESAAWLRNERAARTLLMDYSLHFLDLACMFSAGPWRVDSVRHRTNAVGQTSLIEGRLVSPEYSVSFLLRQGFAPRRTQVSFDFQNYTCGLNFFPDTFMLRMSDENASIHKREARALARATRRKVMDKLRGRDSDPSHLRVIRAAMAGDRDLYEPITVGRLSSFYALMFELGRRVYDGAEGRS